MALSKTQIDRLGERLKKDVHSDDDLRLLDEYRRSFGQAYEEVVRTLQRLGVSPSGRLAKSTLSIAEKLRRESIRLTQIQDVAGCRVVVGNIVDQVEFIGSLAKEFPSATIIDRRESPSHGYRAVHVIVAVQSKSVEIQVRTSLQHLWAELSEKSSDVLDPAIKYGGGPKVWQTILSRCSGSVANYEKSERAFFEFGLHKQAADESYDAAKRDFEALRLDEMSESDQHAAKMEFEWMSLEHWRRGATFEELRLRNENLRIENTKILNLWHREVEGERRRRS